MTPTVVRATYRLQFRNGFSFADAARLAPQLAAGGISHVYASPIFRAVSGSTHGYDVADHGEIEPALGGDAGFREMSAALRAHGLGLILDIVPNHMAAHTDNPWWRDVLEHGPASRYAQHFDVDWSAPKLLLPILGQDYASALRAGDIVRTRHRALGEVIEASGQILPLAPGTDRIAGVDACHEAQFYRLAHWRLARDGLTYRRFFEIAGLVGVRVEDRNVFDDVHRLITRLIADGHVQGLRVDHVDGLADPAAYLDRLGAFGVPVWVEKILEPAERLPPWPVEGTTGYEFVAAVAAASIDPAGFARLCDAYRQIEPDTTEAMTADAKHQIATVNLAGEFAKLTAEAERVFASDPATRDHGPDTVRRALVALSCAMGVYRTYIVRSPSHDDRATLLAAARAATPNGLDEPAAVDDLASVLLSGDAAAASLVSRWQQVTGPLMAKSVEDTLFFRHFRFIALNEVGGHPNLSMGVDALETALSRFDLAATQTHDTKRGEDARARLYQIGDPSAASWWEGFWPLVAPDLIPRWRWGLAQMWLGAVPFREDTDFNSRFCDAVLKSAREAKVETSWTRQNSLFETALVRAADALASRRPDADCWRILRAGAVAGVAQALLKTFGCGPPDVYQGCFSWDFSLVDPDNRRRVDFAAEAELCDTALRTDTGVLTSNWVDGAIKARVLVEGLTLRRQHPALFSSSARFCRLSTVDSPVLVLWRSCAGVSALCAVPLRPLRALATEGARLRSDALGATIVDIPAAVTSSFGPDMLGPGPVDLAPFLERFPVLLAHSRL